MWAIHQVFGGESYIWNTPSTKTAKIFSSSFHQMQSLANSTLVSRNLMHTQPGHGEPAIYPTCTDTFSFLSEAFL
jgi:hypothetical protein